jgi:4-hydroxybenzoate polyprenyltransferase
VFKRVFDFFVFSSLFIAFCAVLMAWQTAMLFHFSLSFTLVGFVFFGSVCSYNLHWYLTPPHISHPSEKLKWNLCNKSIHFVLFIAGVIGSALFSFLLLDHWFWLGLTALFTFLYSAPKIPLPVFSQLKKVAVGKTIFLAFAWAHVTTLLPIVIVTNSIKPEHLLYLINRFFFIYAICILFDYRDVEEDRKEGIKSLITYLNETGIDLLFWISMLICFLSAFFLLKFFPVTDVIALLIPGVLLCFLYYPSKKNFSDYLYYFVLDGLMMLSAPLLLLFKFAR